MKTSSSYSSYSSNRKNGYGWYFMDDWEDYWNRSAELYSLSEDKRKFKESIRDLASKEYLPIDISINKYNTTGFWKGVRRTKIYINDKELTHFQSTESQEKIVKISDKIPIQSDFIDSVIVNRYASKKSIPDSTFIKYLLRGDEIEKTDNVIEEFVKGNIIYSELRKLFRKPTKEENKSNPFGDSDNSWKGGKKVGYYVPADSKIEEIYYKTLNIIKSRISPRSLISYEDSIRKGKRINRNYINGTSYKPLMNRSVSSPKKKKLMIVVDCSGSMGEMNSGEQPSSYAIPFISAITNSGLFDVTHIIYHSCTGWEDVAPRIKKGEIFFYVGCSEGFEYLDDNIPPEWSKDIDYIVGVTDLIYSSQAEKGLYNFLSRSQKHLVLSFKNEGTLKGMNVRRVHDVQSMISAVSTLVGTI